MTRFQNVQRMMNKIVSRLKPWEYKKIDDIRIELCVSPKSNLFTRAWEELVASGRVELCGNEIRINQ